MSKKKEPTTPLRQVYQSLSNLETTKKEGVTTVNLHEVRTMVAALFTYEDLYYEMIVSFARYKQKSQDNDK